MMVRRDRVGRKRLGLSRGWVGVLGLLAFVGCAGPEDEDPAESGLPFRFAVLADVQHADKDAAGSRHYRESLVNLERCVEDLNGRGLAFAVHCGDVIDGRETPEGTREDLEHVLALLGKLDCEVRHVVGNHCLSLPREELLAALGLERAYYSFARGGWRFVVVDSMALGIVGVPPEDPMHARATAWLATHPVAEHPNAQTWNGGLGEEQREWLRAELAAAERNGERVAVFAHHPVLAAATTEVHLAWDHAEVLEILLGSPAFVAWFNGHDHAGGYAEHEGRHFVTMQGMIENAPEETAYAVVEAFPDRLEVHGTGRAPSRTLSAPPAGDQ